MNKKKLSIVAMLLIAVGFIGMAFNKFQFGPEYVNYTRQWDLGENQLKTLNISSSININVSVNKGESSSGYIKFEGNIYPELAEALDQLEPSGSEFNMDMFSSVTLQIFSVDFRSPKGTIDVVLPDQSNLEELVITSHSNNIKLADASSQRIDISVTSGNVSLTNINSDQLNVEVFSGNIEGSDIQSPVKLTNRSGNVKLDQLDGPVDIESFSGSINLGLRGTSPVNVLGRSGNITVRPDPSFRGFYDLKTLSGNVKAPDSLRETTDTIKIETFSGNITIIQ